jgi:short-subunit dehydrogenase
MSSTNSKGTVVITGASGGIGAVYADRFAKRGYDLFLIARDGKRLGEVANKASEQYGVSVETLIADLTDRAALLKLEAQLQADKKVSVLVNNAGFGATKSLVNSSVDELENMIFLNITALTRLTAAVLPNLIEKKHGGVINIASVVAVTRRWLTSSACRSMTGFTSSRNIPRQACPLTVIISAFIGRMTTSSSRSR